jgi:hypothetical protein
LQAPSGKIIYILPFGLKSGNFCKIFLSLPFKGSTVADRGGMKQSASLFVALLLIKITKLSL